MDRNGTAYNRASNVQNNYNGQNIVQFRCFLQHCPMLLLHLSSPHVVSYRSEARTLLIRLSIDGQVHLIHLIRLVYLVRLVHLVCLHTNIWCLDDCATPQLDTVTLQPAPSDTVTIRPINIFILRQSDSTGVGQSDHTQTAQFDPLEVGLNVGCDNPTHVQSDPFSASPGGLGDSSGDDTQMALLRNDAAPPEKTS